MKSEWIGDISAYPRENESTKWKSRGERRGQGYFRIFINLRTVRFLFIKMLSFSRVIYVYPHLAFRAMITVGAYLILKIYCFWSCMHKIINDDCNNLFLNINIYNSMHLLIFKLIFTMQSVWHIFTFQKAFSRWFEECSSLFYHASES